MVAELASSSESRERLSFSDDVLFRAAVLYYKEDATQAAVATALGCSRPTVSRMLAEARARGIVTIEVQRPVGLNTDALAERLLHGLGLKGVWIAQDVDGEPPGAALARQVRRALIAASLMAGDGLLVSPGRTIWEIAHYPLPELPGVIVAPTAGGVDETEPYYQTNEITRLVAAATGGRPWFLYAPALPGPELYELLLREPATQRVFDMWRHARVALLGIGAPLPTRISHPSVLPRLLPEMAASAGDICLRPFDRVGTPIPFPGSDHLVAMELEMLRSLQWTMGVATGAIKVVSILGALRAGYVNALVTDAETALLLAEAAGV